ncbi:hypothetical protein OJ996_16240 [Luteolibacter sp. GHJ8]|uniref:Uncharacterized protein n=1 Tax=Luteolibacter rhizosphaerae TaxID=2989719 RepID=A0ABT3G649_9BACT|nr:hypothetical protein [Luteolibacter rhizosphaerae]MCW1915137.1 hypothetical protein [Luteolibacter rhizosphaerae]
MRSIVSAILILSASLACSEEEAATKITVHLCGEARKPGKHEIPPACSYEELEKATGGWTEWGSGKRFFFLRFPRWKGFSCRMVCNNAYRRSCNPGNWRRRMAASSFFRET